MRTRSRLAGSRSLDAVRDGRSGLSPCRRVPIRVGGGRRSSNDSLLPWDSMHRRSLLAAVAPAIVVALAQGDARPVAAHANRMQPHPPAQSAVTRAPGQVQLLFSEAVEPRFIEVSVLDRDRKSVDRGNAHL